MRKVGLVTLFWFLLIGYVADSSNETGDRKAAMTLAENRNGTVVRKVTKTVILNNDGSALRKATTFRHRVLMNGNETQCFEGLGCFTMDYPWTSILRPLPPPLSPDKIYVQLYCYTREENQRHTVVLWPKVELNNFEIRHDRKLVLITHGFINNGNASWMAELKDSYLKAEDVTLCLVDWGHGAQRLNYLQAASNTRIVGAELAIFLKFLQVNASNVHLIGHSLGAQISSYAAKAVPGIQRLTALDPAQPGFEGCDKAVRLCKDDADFVEVIHTNAAPFLPYLGFGMMMPCGDVDFYMNGGVRQPGCKSASMDVRSIKDLAAIPVELLSNLVACSHARAFEYYKEVLKRNCTIWGRLATIKSRIPRSIGSTLTMLEPRVSTNVTTCDSQSCIPMGLETPQFKARGVFLASTHTAAPYCYGPDFSAKILEEIKDHEKKIQLIKTTRRTVEVKTPTIRNTQTHKNVSFNKTFSY